MNKLIKIGDIFVNPDNVMYVKYNDKNETIIAFVNGTFLLLPIGPGEVAERLNYSGR